jgi:hypothetical protein
MLRNREREFPGAKIIRGRSAEGASRRISESFGKAAEGASGAGIVAKFFAADLLNRLLVFLSHFSPRERCAGRQIGPGAGAGPASSDLSETPVLRSFVSILLFGGLGYEDHV